MQTISTKKLIFDKNVIKTPFPREWSISNSSDSFYYDTTVVTIMHNVLANIFFLFNYYDRVVFSQMKLYFFYQSDVCLQE